ncbi:MAG: DUF4412 domain-containing protein [Bacteroidota bacterium]|nr:DUF4412 domain-containing protein [Bacteroidota bacterium]
MKKKFASSAAIPLLILVTAGPYPVHAQFFKQLLNTAKQTAQNHANDRTSQVTNTALNKVDSALRFKNKGASSTGSGSTTGSAVNGTANSLPPGANLGTNPGTIPVDTSATRRVLGAFAQAAAANPNDTSSADLTMKALNMLAGGGGVSASDSAAAIKSFMTATGGSGLFYQYVTTATAKARGTSRDTSSSWMTVNGNGRKESRINLPAAMGGKMIVIGHASQPQYSMMLDADKRTYSLNVIDTSLINAGGETYQVSRVGNETVQGFSCTHSRLTTTHGSGLFKSTSTMDLWTSTAIPGYALYKRMNDMTNLKSNMIQALDNAGAGGFIVKMTAGDKDYSMSMELLKAETRNCPASLFLIPAGYRKSDESMMAHMLSGAK